MDDLEFRRRAFSNPRDDDPDFLHASRSNSERQDLMDEVVRLEDRISSTLHDISVPSHLPERLKQHAYADGGGGGNAGGSTEMAGGGKSPGSTRYLLLAASLVVAVAVSLSLGLQNQPSAEERAFHDDLLAHLYHEDPRYTGDSEAGWDELLEAIAASGGQVHEDTPLRGMPMKFANHCLVGESLRGAHIVVQGEKGPVSVIFVDNAPVSSVIELRDERFEGKIIPMQGGNLTIAGEKDEALEPYETLVDQSFEWSI